MAEKVIRIDDIDGESNATNTIYFSFRGNNFVIDLNSEHAAEFEEAVSLYIHHAQVDDLKPQRKSSSSGISADERKAITEWARERGHQVSDKGRIAQTLVDGWKAWVAEQQSNTVPIAELHEEAKAAFIETQAEQPAEETPEEPPTAPKGRRSKS